MEARQRIEEMPVRQQAQCRFAAILPSSAKALQAPAISERMEFRIVTMRLVGIFLSVADFS
jgi:hypothetical protein